MGRPYYVYIAANKSNTVLYTGITNSIERRMWEHTNKMSASFTARYNICKLLYYEVFHKPAEAIAREKQIKGGSRKKKIDLITKKNPNYRNLLA